MSVQVPTKPPRVRLSLDVPPELHTALKVAAARRRITMSELLRQLLESALLNTINFNSGGLGTQFQQFLNGL